MRLPLLIPALVLLSCAVSDAAGPAISFTYVPPMGAEDFLDGTVSGVTPANYRLVVYIRVDGLWWIKPTTETPLTIINPDGTWSCDVVTGGADAWATQYAAYLVPVGTAPPLCAYCTKLPEIPGTAAFAQTYRVRTISFGGRVWLPRTSNGPEGPGPNYFSGGEQDVWADAEGLHLTISYHDGHWNATEVTLDQSLGYGTYIYQTRGRVDILDPNMVLGLFTWDNNGGPCFREIDIEYARWSNPADPTNGQFVVTPQCDIHIQRYTLNLTEQNADLTHYVVWAPGKIQYYTYYGSWMNTVPPASALAASWTYEGAAVPTPDTENVHLNFWLNEGRDPFYQQSAEMLITGFNWRALTDGLVILRVPNGGQTLPLGAPCNVTWSSTCFSGTARVFLYRDWTKVRALGDAPITAGAWTWNVPAGEPVGTNYRLRVQSLAAPAASDYSDGLFTIGAPTITVTSPNGGELWQAGTTRTITWTSSGVQGNVRVFLYNNYAKVRPLGDAPATSSFLWAIPATDIGVTYRIRVQSLQNGAIGDYSDGVFSTVTPLLTATSPNGGETWVRGTSQPVTWSATGVTGNVRIQLYNNWTKLANLADVAAANGTWTWPIPSNQVLGATYRIRVLSLSTTANDYSNGLFRITEIL